MTLILTALCKSGICVCADKRNRTWNSNGSVRHEDNLDKIYEFNDIPLIIFNHGVNKFGNRSWEDICSDYESSYRWQGLSLKSISDGFKDFVENSILQQLRQNIQKYPNIEGVSKCAFVLCGLDQLNKKFEFYELHWDPKFTLSFWNDTRLIGSGEGYKKYLESYLIKHSQSNTVEHWRKMNVAQAKKRLIKLFELAVNKQKRSGGDVFSDTYNIKCLSN